MDLWFNSFGMIVFLSYAFIYFNETYVTIYLMCPLQAQQLQAKIIA